MTNYLVEDGLNLWDLITSSDYNDAKVDVCLISGEKLGANHVKLSCKHMFNYGCFVKEIKELRQPTQYCNFKIPPRTLICPYCRQISDGLLLHISEEIGDEIIRNITTSTTLHAIPQRRCEYIYKSGKIKGQACTSIHGYYTNGITRCMKHHKHVARINNKKSTSQTMLDNSKSKCPQLMTCTLGELKTYIKHKTQKPVRAVKHALAVMAFELIGSDSPSILKAEINK